LARIHVNLLMVLQMNSSDKHGHGGNVHMSLAKHQLSVKRFYVILNSNVMK